MKQDYCIEWEGPPSRDHDWLVRETASLWARIGEQPSYPRGCNYLRVPLRVTDPNGPGIDCHWDTHRNALICCMDIEDGPLPEELAEIPNLNDVSLILMNLKNGSRKKH